MAAGNYHHLDVQEVLRETEKAFLLLIDGEEHWVPRSCVANADNYSQGDENCTMSVADYICRQKGLI